MVDAVATQTIYDGPGELMMKFTNISDGTGESAVQKVDVSALAAAADQVVINKIAYATAGMGVDLVWDADTDVLAWHLPADDTGVIDFTDGGKHLGLVNTEATGFTGDVMFTTVGHTSGDRYSIVLYLRKKST